MASVPGGGTFLNPLFQVVSFGAGTAIAPVLRPVLQDLQNATWAEHPVRPIDAQTAASIWLKGIWTESQAKAEGTYTGLDGARMDALRLNLDDPPDLAFMLELWRRGLVTDGEFTNALQHLRIESDWYTAIRGI